MIRTVLVSLIVVAALAAISCIPTYTPPSCDGALCKPIPVGSTPNDVKLATCDQKLVAVVVESGDSHVSTFSIPDGKLVATLDLTQSDQNGSDPFQLAIDEPHQQAMVTLRATDTVALFDYCTGTLLTAPKVGGAFKPQAVIFDAANARYLVGFTNVVKDSTGPAQPPEINAGAVAEFHVDNGTLSPGAAVTLTCKDPQGLALDADGKLWASCTGPLAQDASGAEIAFEDGAIVQPDFASHTIASTVNAARTAPSAPVFVDVNGTSTIFAGSVVTPVLLSAPAQGGGALSSAMAFDGPVVESVFNVKPWASATLLASQFSADAIRVVDVSTTPPTLVDTVQAGPGGTAFHGLLAFDIKPGAGDIDAVALFTLSAEIVPLRLHTLPWATK